MSVIMKTRLFLLLLLFLLYCNAADSQWIQQTSGTTARLTGSAVLNDSSAIVIGKKGTILKSIDKGKSWTKIDIGISNDLNTIYIADGFGLIGGDRIILLSNDSCKTWRIFNFKDNFISSFIGFGGGEVITLFCSLGTDSGKIFYRRLVGTGSDTLWSDTLLVPDNRIIVMGENSTTSFLPPFPLSLFVVTDDYTLSAPYFPFEVHNWKVYKNGTFLPWQVLTGGDIGGEYEFVIGNGGEVAFQPLLLRKHRGDTTWEKITTNLPIGFGPLSIVNFFSASNPRQFICGTNGRIFESSDNGDSWTEDETPTDQSLNCVAVADTDFAYAVGDSGTILTLNPSITSLRYETGVPNSFTLFQNYPNPFNPTTIIGYQLTVSSRVTLKVYDILGREVATLVNKIKPAGSYKVRFNAARLTSGIYIYTLTAGGFSRTKKLVLLK
jgi:photosystem II stability/assembly factor-like uncharacterized protein